MFPQFQMRHIIPISSSVHDLIAFNSPGVSLHYSKCSNIFNVDWFLKQIGINKLDSITGSTEKTLGHKG